MLKPLYGHGMVNYGTDLVVMGGYSDGSGFSSSFYQLSVENGIFKWEKMKPELKIPRSHFVAMNIPDHLVDVQLQRSVKKSRCSNQKAAPKPQKDSKRKK